MTSLPTAELAADPRVRAGMAAQLELRERRLAAGERPLGWKLGFGGAEARSKLGTAAPLLGFLTDRSLLAPAETPSLSGWASPLLEPEIAVRIGAGPSPGGSLDDAEGAIEALGPAFELADLDPPPTEVEEILAGNIFHRAIVLGPSATLAEAPPAGLRGVVTRGDAEAERIVDPQALTGEIVALIRHVADLLDRFGLALRAGEIVICGSIVRPISVAPGDRVDYRLEPVGELSVDLGA
jgi:2-keto-4-pentenoate hydratase